LKIDLIDEVGKVLFWFGLADLAGSLLIAVTVADPSALNHSATYWTQLICGLTAFLAGGFTHLSGWGLKTSGSGNSSPKGPRAPRL
jgi:hypothetical protein